MTSLKRTSLKRTKGRITTTWLLVLGVTLSVQAQESGNYQLDEANLNSGGATSGSSLSSENYRITLGAVGDPLALLTPLVSAGFRADAGFAKAYAPPGEVTGVLLVDPDTLVWNPEAAAWSYNLYRGLVSGLESSYGGCVQTELAVPTASDGSVPAAGDGFFYLVAARNLLGEEGLAGRDSASLPRFLAPCP